MITGRVHGIVEVVTTSIFPKTAFCVMEVGVTVIRLSHKVGVQVTTGIVEKNSKDGFLGERNTLKTPLKELQNTSFFQS